MRSALPWLALASVVAFLAAGLVMLVPMTATGQQEDSSAVTESRVMDPGYSNKEPAGTYQASVTVSQTKGLVRQRVKVTWSGLKQTGPGGAASPYPVVIMQCWGTKAEVTQQNCWNAGPNVGTELIGAMAYIEPYEYDTNIYGSVVAPLDKAVKSMVPFRTRDDGKLYTGGVSGTGWPAGSVETRNPPAHGEATKNAIIPNNYLGSTGADGTGEADIELLTSLENPHLGCGAKSACSLVVIPVGDPTCDPVKEVKAKKVGQCLKTSPSLRNPSTWATQTNWSRRFAFDLDFRESPESCAIDSRPETGFAGSYYAYQLMNNSWRPKFCHDSQLFKLGYTALSDGEARAQFKAAVGGQWVDGSTNALLTSRAVDGDLAKPAVYAPVSVSAVAVSFVFDDENGKEVTEMKLNARLLAKMITQSYLTINAKMAGHPGLQGNPRWWGADPEFRALNPELVKATESDIAKEGAAYPVISLGDMDAIHALTSYIAADKDAMAWLAGADDGYGTTVNPAFHDYKLPVGLLELRDDYRGTIGNLKDQILLSQYANVADNLYNAAVAVTQAWPLANMNESCADQTRPETCVLKRPDFRQPGGNRGMLAITTLGDSRVFGLRQASLRTGGGKFVKPTEYSIALALRGTTLDEKTGVLTPEIPTMHPGAYPGTSVVYAVVPTTGLSSTTANNYAKFLEYAAGPGQVGGHAVGQLPNGYVKLSDPMVEQTKAAAQAVREQKAEVPPPPPGLSEDPAAGLVPEGDKTGLGGNSGGGTDTGGGAGGSGNGGNDNGGTGTNNAAGGNGAAAAAATSTAPATTTTTPPAVEKAATSVATRSEQSGFAKWALPGLLGIAVLSGVIAFGAMVWTQPDHPVRRWIRRLRTR